MKRNNTYLTASLLAIVFASLSITSCNPYFYEPNGNALGLNEKGDIKASGAVYTSPVADIIGKTFKIGYSPIKHLGIQAHHFDVKDKLSMNGVSVGYYNFFPLGKEKDRSKLAKLNGYKSGILLDTYLGTGLGKMPELSPNKFINIQQYNLQNRVNFYFGQLFNISFAHRFNLLYTKKSSSFEESLQNVWFINRQNPIYFNEFTGKFNIGLPKFSSFILCSYSPDSFSFSSLSFQVGATFDINDFFKK